MSDTRAETPTRRPQHHFFSADQAWLGGDRAVSGVVIEVTDGVITSISTGPRPRDSTRLQGVVLPGLVNAHSHAFHRLLRGRTHRQGGDFWLWRERMYEVAATLDPEGYERLATAVYTEMAMAGITTVGEFHYLHHQPGGVPYEDSNEMAHALIRAARAVGIRIGVLDAGYFSAGFDTRALSPVQFRFSDGSGAAWLDRVEQLGARYRGNDDVTVGLAPHSVRAVPEVVFAELVERRESGVPVHIHVSEQAAENQECLEATTLTPTRLLDRMDVLHAGTTLIHATHVTGDDVDAIARSGAMVCYCATTERDLADGLGPAAELAAAGTLLCVGSDSHAVIDLFEEMRGIELHSRLAQGRRGIFSPADLLAAGSQNGARALGLGDGAISEGSAADFIVVDPGSTRLAGMSDDTSLDSAVFAAGADDVTDVFVGGRRIVRDGGHHRWEEARATLQNWDFDQ